MGRVVVVGAGFAGLSCAVELAAAGADVTLLEQDGRVGGKARTLEASGRALPFGPTVLTLREVFEGLAERAGTRLDDLVELAPLDVLARHSWSDGTRLDLHADADASRAAIAEAFGAREAAGYDALRRAAAATWDVVRDRFVFAQKPTFGDLLRQAGSLGLGALGRIDAHRTMWRALEGFFREPKLRQLFGRYATYVGSSPFDAPATLLLVAHVEAMGVWAVAGGVPRLALALADLARSLGVDVRTSAPVHEIVCRAGRATGVVLAEGRVLDADAVVFAGDVGALAQGLLGAGARDAVPAVKTARRSLSALTFSLAFEPRGFPLAYHNVFFPAEDYAHEMRDLFERRRLPFRPTVYLCAEAHAPSRSHASGTRRVDPVATAAAREERAFVIVNAPPHDVRPLSAEEIDRCEHTVKATLSEHGLSYETTAELRITPATLDAWFPGSGGSIYGEVSHGSTSVLARPGARTSVEGLYLASGTAHPGAGVPMASLSGSLAARLALEGLGSTVRSRRAVTPGRTSTS